jgi:hypothetical protein
MNTESPRRKGKALAAPVAALLVALLIVVAAFAYVSFSPKQVTPTSTLTAPRVNTTVGSTSPTSYNSTTTSVSTNSTSSLLSRCSSAVSQNNSVQWIGSVVAGTVSPAILCFQLYYFSVTPETFNLTAGWTSAGLSIWSVTGPYNSAVPSVRGADSNFTVSSSQGEVMMGGPANLGEGTVVAYSILANPGVKGTFWLGFGSALTPPNLPMLMQSQTAEQCPWYGQVVAGNVSAFSAPNGGCGNLSTWSGYCSSTVNSSSSQCSTIPGVPYPLIHGRLFFRVVSVTSSTQ